MTMKNFAVGDVLAASDVNEFCVNTRFAAKPSSTTRSSSPALGNDPDLSVTLDAGKTYLLECFIVLTSPVAAGINHAFSGPSGTVLYGDAKGSGTTFSGQWFAYDGGAELLSTVIGQATVGSGVSDWMEFRGVLVTAGTGGALTYRWSQNTSNAGNTIVRAGSSVLVRRVS